MYNMDLYECDDWLGLGDEQFKTMIEGYVIKMCCTRTMMSRRHEGY